MIQTRDRKRRAPFSNPRTAPKPSCIRSSRKSIFRVTVATTSVRQRFVVALHVCSSRRRHGRRGAHVGTAVFQTRPTTVTIPFCARQLPNYGPPRTQLSRPRVGRPSRTPQFRKFSVRFSLLFRLFRRTSPTLIPHSTRLKDQYRPAYFEPVGITRPMSSIPVFTHPNA